MKIQKISHAIDPRIIQPAPTTAAGNDVILDGKNSSRVKWMLYNARMTVKQSPMNKIMDDGYDDSLQNKLAHHMSMSTTYVGSDVEEEVKRTATTVNIKDDPIRNVANMSSKREVVASKQDVSSFCELAPIFPAPLKARSNKLISSVTFEQPEEQGETDTKNNVINDKDVTDPRTHNIQSNQLITSIKPSANKAYSKTSCLTSFNCFKHRSFCVTKSSYSLPTNIMEINENTKRGLKIQYCLKMEIIKSIIDDRDVRPELANLSELIDQNMRI